MIEKENLGVLSSTFLWVWEVLNLIEEKTKDINLGEGVLIEDYK